MKNEVMNNWGAFESVITAVLGVISSGGFMWWRQTQLEKKQTTLDGKERELNEKVNNVKDEMKTMITEILVAHSKEQAKNFEKMVSIFSNTLLSATKASSEQTQSIINLTETISVKHVEFKDSIKHLHQRLDTETENLRNGFIHKEHCESKMKNHNNQKDT